MLTEEFDVRQRTSRQTVSEQRRPALEFDRTGIEQTEVSRSTQNVSVFLVLQGPFPVLLFTYCGYSPIWHGGNELEV